MKGYRSILRMMFLNGLQYRAAALAGIATQFAWGVMEILLFSAFYRASSQSFPMSMQGLSSYIWLQQAFLTLYMIWFLDSDLFDLISGGSVAYELCRPVDLYPMWFVRNMATRLSRVTLRCLPILLVAAFLPAPYGIGAPASPGGFLLFLVSMALAFLLVVAFCMLIYITVFYTLSPLGVRIIVISLTDLLTGSVVPLPFFPDRLRRIAECLPFAYMQNLPLQIYGGGISGAAAVRGLGIQLFWLAVFFVGGWLWMRRTLRRVSLQGG